MFDAVFVITWILLGVPVTIVTPYFVASAARDKLYVSPQRLGTPYWLAIESAKLVNDVRTAAPPKG